MGFLKNRDLQFSQFCQRVEILSFQICYVLLQGLPGSLAPPPARVGGLEQDGGAGHDHQLHRGICNCRGEQRWWAGLSVDVNFGKLGVKGKKVDMHSHLVSLVHIDCEALAFGLACNANLLPLVSVRVDFCHKKNSCH